MNRSNATIRRAERLDISLAGECRTPWGQIATVVLSEISTDGCRVKASQDLLLTGDHVLIRTSSLFGASGTVRWVESATAGIEFDCPLDRAVIRQFERNQIDGAKIIVPFRDQLEVMPI